jgi:hypothetical protein
MSYLDIRDFADFKTSYKDIFFKNLNVEFNKITVNYGDDWINLKTSEFMELAESTNRKLIEKVKNYYFDRLDNVRINNLVRLLDVKPVIEIKDTAVSVKEKIYLHVKESNNSLSKKAGTIKRKALVSKLLRWLVLLVSFPIRLILTGFFAAVLISIVVTFSSELMKYAKTEFPWYPQIINEIITIIGHQFNVSIVYIIKSNYWFIVVVLTLLTLVLIKNIFKPIIKYLGAVSLITSKKNQKVIEITEAIMVDLKKAIDAEVWVVYKDSYLKALDDYSYRIDACLNQLRNPVIDMTHEFKAKTENMLAGYSAGKVASLYGKEVFNNGFTSDIIAMVLNRQMSNQQLNDVIEQQIQKNMPIIDRKIREIVSNDVHKMLNNYFDMISKQGCDVTEIGGVSLKGFEQQLSSRLNIPLTKVSVSVCSINAMNIDILTNAVIGAGTIGGAMLLGGAGIALFASGPVGLIVGAINVGNLLFGNKEGISKLIKNLFGGDPTEKLKNHFSTIEKNVVSNIELIIEPAYKNIKETLNDITKDYIDAVIKEVSLKHIVYLER